jgi:AraC-like DNA-binding protein
MVLGTHGFIIYGMDVTVSARPAKDLPVAANVEGAVPGLGIVDMRGGSPVRAGTFAYDGVDLVTDWHSHDLHQIEYAFEGVAEVETDSAHYLLPPQQAVWIPAGLTHRTTLKRVRSVAVFFDPAMVEGANDRVRILAATPLIREMIVYAARWPIARPVSDQVADAFFDALALLVVDWLAHEAPLCLPTSSDPTLQAVMDYTNANLAHVTIADVCATVGISDRSLRRQFGAAAGMTWRQYLLQSRLMRAMALLTEPGRTVIDVATAVGFDSVSAFTRAFVRLTSETPTAYRRRVSTELGEECSHWST